MFLKSALHIESLPQCRIAITRKFIDENSIFTYLNKLESFNTPIPFAIAFALIRQRERERARERERDIEKERERVREREIEKEERRKVREEKKAKREKISKLFFIVPTFDLCIRKKFLNGLTLNVQLSSITF